MKVLPFRDEVLPAVAPPGQINPVELVEQAEGELLAAEAIQELRPEYREVFLLRQVERLPVKEVAEILGLPEGTVKTYLHRARKHLIDFLAEKGWE